MSLLNTMLQELDRRHGGSSLDVVIGAPRPAHVRAVKPTAERRFAFWAVIGLLAAIAVGWVGWVGYELSPRRLVTDLAFKTVDEARARQATPPAAITPRLSTPQPAPVAAAPEPTPPPVATPAPAAPPQVEMLRLAESIATPIPESKPAAPVP